jgi:hypothetical protein
MYTAATLLSSVLAGTPDSPTSTDRAPPPETVEFDRSDDTVQITARDSGGEVSAEVFMWIDADGRTRLDAAWPDGLYLSVTSNGEDATVDTENAVEVAERMERLDVAIQQTQSASQWLECAGTVVAAGIACIPPIGVLAFVGCATASTFATCACAETFSGGEDSCWD